MKRRLRKKKRLGEFKELGFEVKIALRAALDAPTHNALTERFIAAIEARNLAFGGGFGSDNQWNGFVSCYARGSATELDREAIRRWIAEQPEIVGHEVGPLRDAWHGWR